MNAAALGHRLETLQDGLTTFCNGEAVPMPLIGTEISVHVKAGLAIVKTARRFQNAETAPIEAVLTFPVGFDAVVTGLAAIIDGRRMIGVAKEKAEARDSYESALDEGRLSVLHEEALRGIHVLSVGALPSGAEVSVEMEQVVPLTNVGGKPFLRIPVTAGQIYGISPLLPSDDLVTASGVRHEAVLTVATDAGRAFYDGQVVQTDASIGIVLDRAIELVFDGLTFGNLSGTSSDGRAVEVSFSPEQASERSLDLHVLVDRSGSTGGFVQGGKLSIWEAMRNGLAAAFRKLTPSDRITLWQFDTDCEYLGSAEGNASAQLVAKLEGPRGGTNLSPAIRAALAQGAKDILVLTDGQTWAHLVEELKSLEVRISAILVGENSLDANIGHLCALTNGELLYAPGSDVASSLSTALQSMRMPVRHASGQVSAGKPELVKLYRGGVAIHAAWRPVDAADVHAGSDAVGRFAAFLALPILNAADTEVWARAHSLCTHTTSLVLIDEAGEATEGLSRMRKVPLMSRSDLSDLPSPAYSLRAASASYIAPTSRAFGVPAPESLARLQAAVRRPEIAQRSVITNSERDDHLERQAGAREILGGLLSAASKGPQSHTEKVFRGFLWDEWGDEILSGNLSMLTLAQAIVVHELKEKILSDPRWCEEKGASAEIFALGLIAMALDDRLAQRFGRRAIKNAPIWVSELSSSW